MDRRAFIGTFAGSLLIVTPVVDAQRAVKVWRVGFLSPTSASLSSENTRAVLEGMREIGYIEGKSVLVEWRFADGKPERLPGLAAELVQLKVDVIVTTGSADQRGAESDLHDTRVMTSAGDPVRGGFVKSLARPRQHYRALEEATAFCLADGSIRADSVRQI